MSHTPLELICQCSSLYTAISFINGTRVQNTGNKNFTNHLPLQKSRTALNGNADTIHNGHIVFFAAGNQCTFLPCNNLTSNNQRENLIDYPLDLCRDGVPIYRHGEYNSISIQNCRSDGIEIIIKGTCLTRRIAGLTGVTAANIHHSSVKTGNGMSFGLSRLDKRLGHSEAIAVFTRAAGNYYNIFTH